MHNPEIAGMEPASSKRLVRSLLVAVVAKHDRIAADDQFAKGLSVGRHFVHQAVDDPGVCDGYGRNALAGLQARLFVEREIVPLRPPCAGQARSVGLRHAVEMDHLDPQARHLGDGGWRWWGPSGDRLDPGPSALLLPARGIVGQADEN